MTCMSFVKISLTERAWRLIPVTALNLTENALSQTLMQQQKQFLASWTSLQNSEFQKDKKIIN